VIGFYILFFLNLFFILFILFLSTPYIASPIKNNRKKGTSGIGIRVPINPANINITPIIFLKILIKLIFIYNLTKLIITNNMYLLFDIGGTKTRLAVSEDLASFDEPLIFDTEQNFSGGIIKLHENIKKITGGKKIKAVVGGMAGVFDKDRIKLLKSPNLPDWENKLVTYEIERICGVKPEIYNDADLAALGEAVFGSGRDGKIVAYMTVSTGIGGGLIIDKKIQERTYGFEPGHMIMNPDTKERLQDLIGGRNLEKKYKIPAKEITDPIIYKEITRLLGVALHNVIMLWSPDTIIMGGGISRDLDMEEIEDAIKENMVIFPEIPKVKRAELGSLNGVWGALAQARNL